MTTKEKEFFGEEREPKESLIRPASPEFRPPPEVADWLTNTEKGKTPPQTPVTDDQGQIILTSPSQKPVKIILPLSQEEIVNGLKKGVQEAVRWLAEWCYRLIRMRPQKVVLKNESL